MCQACARLGIRLPLCGGDLPLRSLEEDATYRAAAVKALLREERKACDVARSLVRSLPASLGQSALRQVRAWSTVASDPDDLPHRLA